jgi:hypothetical protein
LKKPHFLGGRSSGAIFDDGHLELYNLAADTSEKNNLAKRMSGKTKELRQLLRQWRKSLESQSPPAN